MFNNYCTTTKYVVLIEETGADYPFLFRTTSNLHIANIIVNDYFVSILLHNPDAELIENEVLTHPDMIKSWRLKFKGNENINISIVIYKVKNVEITN